jgi:hypothetical protein
MRVEDHLVGTARQQVNQGEHENGEQEQQGDGLQNTPDDISSHRHLRRAEKRTEVIVDSVPYYILMTSIPCTKKHKIGYQYQECLSTYSAIKRTVDKPDTSDKGVSGRLS